MDAVGLGGAAAVVHLAAAAAYAGFQWTVRVVVYPQLATAGRALDGAGAGAGGGAGTFPALEASHSRRTSRLVAPLFLALVGSTAWVLLASGPREVPVAVAAAVCTAVVLGATAFGAVPQHRLLGRRWDEAAHRRLVRWDGVRVVAATSQLVLALVLLLR